MNQAAIRAALEKRLATLSPAVTTFKENQKIPDGQTAAHLRCKLIPAAPGASGFDASSRAFERGIFQVSVFELPGKGAGAGQDKAEAIRNLFEPGLILTEDGIQVRIPRRRPPAIRPAIEEPKWYQVPVDVFYTAFT